MIPLALIDWASCSRRSSSKFVLGWKLFGSMRSRSISTISSLVVAGLSDSSALSPRPNALLVMSHYLLCQLKIAFRPARLDVIEYDRLAVTRSFGQAYVT